MVAMPFDLYYLFAENIFGGILLSGFGIAAILYLIGMLGRMSFISNIMLVVFFLMTFAIGYVGGLATLIVGPIAIFYFFRGFINFVTSIT